MTWFNPIYLLVRGSMSILLNQGEPEQQAG